MVNLFANLCKPRTTAWVILALLVALAFGLSGCQALSNSPSPQGSFKPATDLADLPNNQGQLRVTFLDVGQADSILVQLPNQKVMLVDAGSNEDGPRVISELKRAGVKQIDYLVGTHPHEDHVGGIDDVIRAFPIGTVVMPKVPHTTDTYLDVLRALEAKKLKVAPAGAGLVLLDERVPLKLPTQSPVSGPRDLLLRVQLLGPVGSKYEDLNNWSAVVRVQYGETVFLLMGDAEATAESEILAAAKAARYGFTSRDLRANVLKVGHHGSSSASTKAFLEAVQPEYAVISVGAHNDYGHPHRKALSRIRAMGIRVLRTDEDGTIVFLSDGRKLTYTVSQ